MSIKFYSNIMKPDTNTKSCNYVANETINGETIDKSKIKGTLQIKDIRIGNFIQYIAIDGCENDDVRVKAIEHNWLHASNVWHISGNIDGFRGIEITEEWVAAKLGDKINQNRNIGFSSAGSISGNQKYEKDGIVLIKFADGWAVYRVSITNTCLKSGIKYIHKLQNWWYEQFDADLEFQY